MAAGWFDRDAAADGWFAPESEEAGWFDAELLGGEAPAQELTAPLVSNEQTFYGPQVTATYGIAAPLYGNEQAFYAPSISTGPVSLLPGLLENAQSFYAPRIGQPEPYDASWLLPGGAVFQWPGDGKAYLLPGGQTVQPAPQELQAPLVGSGTQFFDATVTVGGVTLLPSVLLNDQTFFGPTVSFAEPYEYSLLLPGGAVFQYSGDEQIYLLPGGLVVQPPAQDVTPPTPTPSAGAALWRDRPPRLWTPEDDDADLLEIVPAIIGVLNAKQRH